MPSFKFERLVRFKNPAGQIHYGEVEEKNSTAESLSGKSVLVYKGENPWDDDFERTSRKETISEVRTTPAIATFPLWLQPFFLS
jgi:hypothetical protein